jgi:hypothetical protein
VRRALSDIEQTKLYNGATFASDLCPTLVAGFRGDGAQGQSNFLRHNSKGTRTEAIKGNEATDSGVFVSPTTPFTAARRPKKYASANTPCASTQDTNALTAFSASSNVYCFVGFDFPHLCEVPHVMPSCQGLTSILPRFNACEKDAQCQRTCVRQRCSAKIALLRFSVRPLSNCEP